MDWNMFGTNWHLFGNLAAIMLIALVVFATGAFVHIWRMRRVPPLPISEGIGAKQSVLGKVRKRQPLTAEELQYATRFINQQRSPLAFCIPATTFSLGCAYVLGSLEQLHGATPSERTFIGVIPMMGSINMTAQLLRIVKLKRRLPAEAAAE